MGVGCRFYRFCAQSQNPVFTVPNSLFLLQQFQTEPYGTAMLGGDELNIGLVIDIVWLGCEGALRDKFRQS